jgi:hypothetical protein
LNTGSFLRKDEISHCGLMETDLVRWKYECGVQNCIYYLERTCGPFYMHLRELQCPVATRKDTHGDRMCSANLWMKCGSALHEVVQTRLRMKCGSALQEVVQMRSLPGLMKAALRGQIGIPYMK